MSPMPLDNKFFDAGKPFAAQLQFALLTLMVYVLQFMSGNFPLGGISNWLIPDGLTYHEVVRTLASDGFDAIGGVVPEQFAGVPVNPALFLYYFPFYTIFGVFGYLIANLLLAYSCGNKYVLLAIVLTPYFLISFALPSKDLLVLALFIPLIDLLIRRRFLWTIPLSVLIFLVRDGAGVIALGCIMATLLTPQRSLYRLYLIIVAAIAITVLNSWVYEYFSEAFIMSRNLQIAQEEGNFDVGGEGVATYLVRLIGNSTNLSFRPVFFDISGNVPLLAVAYWISGWSQIVCTIFSVEYLVRDSTDTRSSTMAMLFLVSLLIISLNPLVQPRYQLFFVVILLGHVLRTRPAIDVIRAYLYALLISLAAAGAYLLSGIGLPPAYESGQLVSFP